MWAPIEEFNFFFAISGVLYGTLKLLLTQKGNKLATDLYFYEKGSHLLIDHATCIKVGGSISVASEL